METYIKYRADLNKLLPPNPITLECGSAEGLYTEYILKNWNPLLHIIVDLWEHIPSVTGDGNSPQEWHTKNYKEVLERVKPFRDKVEIHRGLSWQMAQHIPDNSLDLCYIDACHEYEAVSKDIRAYYPKVKTGGIMAFHDTENPDYGAGRAVRDFIKDKGITLHIISENHWADAGCWFRK